MTFGLPPVRLVADFRASAMGIKPKSPGSVATVSLIDRNIPLQNPHHSPLQLLKSQQSPDMSHPSLRPEGGKGGFERLVSRSPEAWAHQPKADERVACR